MEQPPAPSKAPRNDQQRRRLLAGGSRLAMLAGLAGGYGAFAFIAARFLYPARPDERRWLYVAPADRLARGESLLYRSPGGETINVTRQGDSGSATDFVALSSTCPHLGCQVYWEADNHRFFCPCHNGTFDAAGRGTGGPPGDAGQSLPRYALRVDGGLLYIEVPVSQLAEAKEQGEILEQAEAACGPGHDPCLSRLRGPRFGGGQRSDG